MCHVHRTKYEIVSNSNSVKSKTQLTPVLGNIPVCGSAAQQSENRLMPVPLSCSSLDTSNCSHTGYLSWRSIVPMAYYSEIIPTVWKMSHLTTTPSGWQTAILKANKAPKACSSEDTTLSLRGLFYLSVSGRVTVCYIIWGGKDCQLRMEPSII